MQNSDGMHYAPKGKPAPVVKPGEFVFAAVGLDHGHIGGMCNGLMEAGATLKWIYDPDPAKVEQYCKMYPQARAARSEAEVLEDPEVRLVAGACVTSQRCALGLRVIAAGKDYFTDKAPLTPWSNWRPPARPPRKRAANTCAIIPSACMWRAPYMPGSSLPRGPLARC